jgi:hypothetical protein
MEIMMPSLMVILLATGIAFFVIPDLAPSVLILVSSILLAFAIYTHMNRFGITEYERATWIYTIRDYMGFIILAVVLAAGYGFMLINENVGGQYRKYLPTFGSSSSTNMGPLSLPTSGGGMGVVARTVSSRINELLRKGRISVD